MAKPMHDTVSVLISVYNGSKTLSKALQSIAEQTYRPLEVIFIDDGSRDNTFQIAQEYARNHPNTSWKLIQNTENIGLTKSLNKAASMATGSYLARIDADDWWKPEKTKKQMDFIRSHPDHGIVGTWYVNQTPKSRRIIKNPKDDLEIRKSIYKKNPFGHSTVIFAKDLWKQSKGYDANLRHGQDLDLWFRFLPLTKLANIPEVLCERCIAETISKPLQMKTHIRTVQKYIRRYDAPRVNYLYLVEPFIVMLTPRWLRKLLNP